MRFAVLFATLLLAPLAAAALPGTVPVLAAGNSFTPPVLVIPAGTTVEWQGVALPHTVTTAADLLAARDGRENDGANSDADPDTFNHGLLMGGTVSHTFNEAGTFAYFCDLHYRLGMVGTIVVN